MGEVALVRAGDRVVGPSTPGMRREQAIADEGLWSGYVTTQPGMVSGWHHHADYRTVLYVLRGVVRLEFSTGGSAVVDATAGDFALIPPNTVHRESNPSEVEAVAIVMRTGAGGEAVVNVDGPDA